MALNTWLIFVVTVFFVSATPGPNMLLAMSHGIRFGLRGALPTMAGLLLALGLIMAGSAAGLGAMHRLVNNIKPIYFSSIRF